MELDKSSTLLNKGKLRAIVKRYGEYPSKYRFLIWKFLLQLPGNSEAYQGLVSKGEHISWRKLVRQYPIKSRKLMRSLEMQLSNMAHWGTIFEELPYLPLIVFPFVKIFPNEQVACFEITATFLKNWCRNWFDYFPNPPITVLNEIETLLHRFDPDLYGFFVRKEVPSSLYAWTLMQSIFTEVLSKDDFLIMFDHLFSNSPLFFKFVIVAYLKYSRGVLIRKNTLDEVEQALRKCSGVDINKIIQEAYRIYSQFCSSEKVADAFEPIPKGSIYPTFDAYPKYIVDFHLLERERIRLEEEDYWNRKKVIGQLKKETAENRIQEEIWARQQKMLNDAEQSRRDQIADEDKRLERESGRVNFLLQEEMLQDIQSRNASLKASLDNITNAKLIEMQKLEDEIKRRASSRSRNMLRNEEDVALRKMRLNEQQTIFNNFVAKQNPTAALTKELDLSKKRRAIEEEIARRKVRAEEEERVLASKNFENRVYLMAKESEATRLRQEANLKLQLEDVKRKFEDLEIERQKRVTKAQEDQLYNIAADIEARRSADYIDEKEEEMRLEAIKLQEEKYQREKALKRQKLLDDQMKQHLLEREIRLKKVREVESLQRAQELEAQIMKERSSYYEQDIKEERELQRMLFEIEKQKQTDREVDEMLARREEELNRRYNIQSQMNNVSKEALRQEREKFAFLREEIRRDGEKMSDMNRRGEALLLTSGSGHKKGPDHRQSPSYRNNSSEVVDLDDSTSTTHTYTVKNNMEALNQSHTAHMEELKREAEALIERRKATQEALQSLLHSPIKPGLN